MQLTTPEEVGLSAARLARIRTRLQQHIDAQKLPGALTLVARHGKIAHLECVGMVDIQASKPMSEDAIFRIYSMTKPITSAAVLMLYEEGLFHLSDSITRFIPEFKKLKVLRELTNQGPEMVALQREITIRDVLTHTAGFSYGVAAFSPTDTLYGQADLLRPDRTLQEMIELISELPLAAQPGTEWRYSISVDILAHLVEVVSGKPFDDFLKERIFEPLGMIDTGYVVPEGKRSRLAGLYSVDEQGQLVKIDPANFDNTTEPTLHYGGMGLVSTASDYLRFAQMLLNGGELDGIRLLGRKTVDLMTMNHLPPALVPIKVFAEAPRLGYGFGLGVRVLVDVAQSQALGSVGEYGWDGAASTYFMVDPKEELVGLMLTQFMPTAQDVMRQFKTLVYQSIVA